MKSQVKPLLRRFTLSDGERVEKVGAFGVDNGGVIECAGPVLSYLELSDRLIVVLHWYHATNLFDICRNIFCYAKADGRLIWQIEQPKGEDGRPLEAVYKYINCKVKGADGSYSYAHESVQHESGIWGKIYLRPFRYGVDRLEAMTLATYPCEYWVDYETGEVEWFAIHQKV